MWTKAHRARDDARLKDVAPLHAVGQVARWLGREDSNLRMAESKSAALPLGDAPAVQQN